MCSRRSGVGTVGSCDRPVVIGADPSMFRVVERARVLHVPVGVTALFQGGP
jgi:hypothetical protein